MGLKAVEVVMEVEDQFDIVIDDEVESQASRLCYVKAKRRTRETSRASEIPASIEPACPGGHMHL